MAKHCGYPDYKATLQSADAILCALDDLYICELESYDSDFNLSLVDGKCSEPHGSTAGRRLAVSGRGDELRAADALLMLTGTNHEIRRATPHVQQQTVQPTPSKPGTMQQSRTQFGTQQNSSQTGEVNRNAQHRSVQWRLTQTTRAQQNHTQTRTVQCCSTQTVAVHRNPPKHEITKSNSSQSKSVHTYTTQTKSMQQTVTRTQETRQGVSRPEIVMWNPVEVFVQHGFPHSELRKWRRPKSKNTQSSSQKEATQKTVARTVPTQDKPPQTRVMQRNPTRTPILQQALSPEQQNSPQTEWEDVDVVMVPINEVVQHLAHQDETIPLQVHTYVLSALLQQLYRKVLAQCRNGAARQLMLEKNYESESSSQSSSNARDMMAATLAYPLPPLTSHSVRSEVAGNTVTFGSPFKPQYIKQPSDVQQQECHQATGNRIRRPDFGLFEAAALSSTTYGTRRKLTRNPVKCNRHTEDMLHLLMVLSAALQLFGESDSRNPMPDIYRCLGAAALPPPQLQSTASYTEAGHHSGEGEQQEQQQKQQQKKQRCAVKNKKQEQEKGGGDTSVPQNIISSPDNKFASSGHGEMRASSGTSTKELDAIQSSSSRKTMPTGARDAEMRGRQQCHSSTGKDRSKEENGDNIVKPELENSYLSTVDCSDQKHIKAEDLDKILRVAESTILVLAGCDPKPKKTRHHEIVLDSKQAAQKRAMYAKQQENADTLDHCCDAEPGELFLIVPVDERIDKLCKMSVETLIEEGVIAVVDRSHQRKSCKHAETTTTPQVSQVNTGNIGSSTCTQGSYSCTPSSKITSGSSKKPHHTTESAGKRKETDPLIKQTRLSAASVPRGSGPISSSSVGGKPPTEEKKEPVTTDPYEITSCRLQCPDPAEKFQCPVLPDSSHP